MKKSYVPFVPALISFGLLLILTGCTDIFAPPIAPAKTGLRITVSDGSKAERTLLPEKKPDIDTYILEFENKGDPTVKYPLPPDTSITITGGETEMILEDLDEGVWIITAKGYTEEDVLVAEGEIEIDYDGGNGELTIDLYPVTTGDPGTFTYDVTITASDIDRAVLDILSYSTRTSVLANVVNLSTNSSDSIELPAGYYLMTVKLVKTDTTFATDTHVVHIYSGMETNYSNAFSNDDFSIFKFEIAAGNLVINAVPAKDEDPDDITVTVPSDANYEVEPIEWFDDEDLTNTLLTENFAPDTVYRAEITLTAATGYTFTGYTGTWTVNSTPVTPVPVIAPGGASLKIIVVFPRTASGGGDTKIDIAAIPGITVPEAGQTREAEIIETAQYTGTVGWYPAVAVDAKFAAGTPYTATITLTAKPGFTLEGVTEDFFTVEDATTVTYAAGSDTVTALFPKTADTIDINDILGVVAPVTGADPVRTITETTQYTGTVTWNPTVATGGKFAPGTDYTATINLTAEDGFTLYGVPANIFTVAGELASNAADSGVITTAAFPKTALIKIDIAAILGVEVPETGATPVTTVTETLQFAGTVTWLPDHTTFAAATQYTATITLTPLTGYTLEGVTANYFTVAGTSELATNAAGSGVIEAKFPATEAATGGGSNFEFKIEFTKPGDENIVLPNFPDPVLNLPLDIIAPSGYDGYTWIFDEDVIATGEDTQTLTIESLTVGKHMVLLIVEKDGMFYSKTLTLTVTN
jgi:hypothetical protein